MLADLLTKYVEIIYDTLLNDCDLDPEIDTDAFRSLRYHARAIPDDICSNGLLSAWWENISAKSTTAPCPAFPVAVLNAKYAMCWKQADVKPNKITIYYEENDADAARLATVAECVTHRLLSLVCRQANQIDGEDEPLDYLFLAMANKPKFLGCTPGGPQGGIAWVNWRVEVGLLASVPVS